MSAAPLLRSSAIFCELSNDQLAEIWSHAKVHSLLRGAILVRQKAPSDSVYVVVSGRFDVFEEGRKDAVNEIGAGEPIGEIGFFSGEPRTATLVAARDSIVLELDRPSFDNVARQVPSIYQTLLRAVARRLAERSSRAAAEAQVAVARTVAVIAGGSEAIPKVFFERLDNVFGHHGKGLLLTRDYLTRLFGARELDDPTVSTYLNTIEHEYELIAYVADAGLTDWTRKAIRQADQLLVVVTGTASDTLNPVEAFALEIHPPARRRLVCLHDRRVGHVEGTAAWLRCRDVFMPHHVALDDDLDVKSLHRFLTGRALGFVAAGGGGFGPSHLGIFKAFAERGVTFDIFGGTSVGAGMLAGFAALLSPEEIDRGTQQVVVKSRGFKQYTFPRYALVDHVGYDEALRKQYRGVSIEDVWRPYFAVATILDGSGQGPYLMRRGLIWKAVRASSSIPAVLPPLFTDDGHMLVDGGLVENIPLRSMKTLKSGPNLVVHFGVREALRFSVDYGSIPGRWRLLARMLTPGGRRKLPVLPGPIGVLRRCLVLNQTPNLLPVGPRDLVLTVPAFPGATFLDFDRHFEVFEAAYQWGREQIDRLVEQGDPALAEILATVA